MKQKNVIKLGALAACVTIGGAAYAGQPVNIEAIRCSDNGVGNGGELFTAVGIPPSRCERFILTSNEDQPGMPGQNPTDPN